MYRVATQCSLSSLELRVQFCLLVCCTYPSSSTVNKEKNLIDQRASLRVDTRETQQYLFRVFSCLLLSFRKDNLVLAWFHVNSYMLQDFSCLFTCLFRCLSCLFASFRVFSHHFVSFRILVWPVSTPKMQWLGKLARLYTVDFSIWQNAAISKCYYPFQRNTDLGVVCSKISNELDNIFSCMVFVLV